ncbi:MAG: glutamate racemase [Candidatus Thiodiazotropha sp.]|jgi:glutamate racemase
MSSDHPIGIFDSGIGGLSVLEHIRKLLPLENLIYVSDRGHLPYGNKHYDYILKRSQTISEFLLGQEVKAIVIACNTATAVAVGHLRQTYTLPIIGMEPGVKPAIRQSRSGLIGVLATQGTLTSRKFQALLRQHANGAEIIFCPCHGWVEAIEHNGHDHQETHKLVKQQLEPILEAGADTLVLGCTHYPFLRATIENIAGTDISIIDTGPAVARQLYRRLADQNLLSKEPSAGSETFWCSAATEQTQELLTKLRNKPTLVKALPEVSY